MKPFRSRLPVALSLAAGLFGTVSGAGLGCTRKPASLTQKSSTDASLPAANPDPHAPPPASIAGSPPSAELWESGGWALQPSEDGSLALVLEQTEVLRFRHAGYGPAWKWGGPKARRVQAPGGETTFVIEFKTLPVTLTGTVIQASEHAVRVDYQVRVGRDLEGLKGVGLEIMYNHAAWGGGREVAEITQERDLTVAVPAHGQVHVEFPAQGLSPHTFEERKKRGLVRAFWFEGSVKQGSYASSMTLTASGPLRALPDITKRYGEPDLTTWHKDALVWDDWPVDLGFLNAAHGRAGSHGRVQVHGDALKFSDGSEAKFWGTNITAASLFEAGNEAVVRQARRLSALGYNLVRLHHHDVGWIKRNVFDRSGNTTQRLRADALDRLDWWVKCLADEGIYVWVDLHVGREFLAGDRIDGYEDMLVGPSPRQAKGFNYINPRVEDLMEAFAESYMRRVNAYTGTSWMEEPAIMGVLITNENDLTDHFGTAFLPGKGRKTHRQLFMEQAKAIIGDLSLRANEARKVWQPGAGKVLLAEMQHRYAARARAHLRSVGVQAPIATTNFWGNAKLYSLPSLAYGDLIDVHSYGEAEALGANPRRSATWVHNIAAAQVANKPLSVSEWSVPYPAADRFTAPLWLASIASLQGWDAMMAFNYNMGPIEAPRRSNKWITWTDPALQALAPTAALLYRRGDVSPAQETFALQPSLEDLWGRAAHASTSKTLRTLPERSKLVIALPDHPKLSWDKAGPVPPSATVIRDLDRDFLEPGSRFVRSDTGELQRDWVAGIQTIDTARIQAASGWIGGRTISLRDVTVQATTPKATICVITLDERPIAASERLLITAVARARPDPSADGHQRSEPVAGTVSVRGPSPRVLVPTSPRSRANGANLPATGGRPGTETSGGIRFELPTDEPTHWFLLVPAPESADVDGTANQRETR